MGVAPEVKVAVCLEPSPELLATLLGVLKAGGAYVPIAPSMPPERVARLLDSCGSSMVITDRGLSTSGAWHRGRRLVMLDGPAGVAELQSDSPPAGIATADNLAYVISTSGSSGDPKGVMVPHRAISNTLQWRQRAFPLNGSDRALVTFSFAFDASIFELFQPLLGGAAVVFPDAELGGDPARIISAVRRYQITVLGVIPSWLSLLVSDPELAECRSLRRVFCGGETLPAHAAESIRRSLAVEINNMYGPTETAMEATFLTCSPGRLISIGRPIANVRAYVLDHTMQPVPSGAAGELYLGGAGLARGYVNNPGLTAECFVPDPFATSPGARMYRTGDLCRWLPDGNLELLGRRDRQVKLHGHRIELGEVEAALLGTAGVREAAVVLREDQPGAKRLVGYVTLQSSEATSSERLRRDLSRRLLQYMVPSAFIFLDSLPRTVGGKLDRSSLPAPRTPSLVRSVNEEPLGSLKQILSGLWQQVLGVSELSEHDDFFELGGNSIQAAILAHKLEDMLQEPVYAAVVYDSPTIERLADYLRRYYLHAVLRLLGPQFGSYPGLQGTPARSIQEDDISQLRQLIRTLPDRQPRHSGLKNPSAVFILSPPRSGSTLLRVMLGAHPRLFAPPELQLLNFNTLRDRRAALSSPRDDFWLQGTVRAVMQALRCDVGEASDIVERCEEQDMSVKDFYRFLQDALGDVALVDKTPTYSLDVRTLTRAEEDFEGARYLHLVRHPSSVITSFDEAKLHVFFPPFLSAPHPFTPVQLAELVWTISHQNILDFLHDIPDDRRHVVSFEELVGNPRTTMERVSDFLGLSFDAATVSPYQQDQRSLMTDPVQPMARMLGDVKFHQHGRIRPEVGRHSYPPEAMRALGDVTRRLASTFGYEASAPVPPALVGLQVQGAAPPIYFVHPAAGGVSCYQALVLRLGSQQPCYAFRAPALDGAGPVATSMQELASSYLLEMRRHQPRGPYRLGGWSFGGVVAFEMALQLIAGGEEVAMVALLSSHLPRLGVPPRHRNQNFVQVFLREHRLDVTSLDWDADSAPQLLEYAFEKAKPAGIVAANSTLRDFGRVIRRHERVYNLHVDMARRYRPQGRIPSATVFEAQDGSTDGDGPFLKWDEFIDDLTFIGIPGDHFSILQKPNVDALGEALKRELLAADSPQEKR
jgi:amino acid adenylation domain-containing protein